MCMLGFASSDVSFWREIDVLPRRPMLITLPALDNRTGSLTLLVDDAKGFYFFVEFVVYLFRNLSSLDNFSDLSSLDLLPQPVQPPKFLKTAPSLKG